MGKNSVNFHNGNGCPFVIDPMLEILLGMLHTAIIIFNEDGYVAHINRAASELLAQTSESSSEPFQYLHFLEFLYDHAIDNFVGNGLDIQNISEQKKMAFHECISLQNGRCYLARVVEGSAGHIIAEMTDISRVIEQTDRLDDLAHENNILMEAVQSSNKGVLIADNNTNEQTILFANQAFWTLMGCTYDDVVGHKLYDFFKKECPESIDELSRILSENKKGDFWKRCEAKDGNVTFLEMQVFVGGQEQGKQDFITVFVSDETQSKLQEVRLRQTQKLEAIGQLAGGVAHDFNNVLSIVDGFTRLSETALKRGDDISNNLLKIRKAVQRGSAITRQLLSFGKYNITENKTFDVCQLVREMEELLAPLLGIEMRLLIQTADTPLYVHGTSDHMTQIVMNLVLNARDAMNECGTIVMTVCEEEQHNGTSNVVLSVADSGSGISEETIEKIFDPFFTTKEQGKGTGLGLTLVYGLVKQMKGDIDVESQLGEWTRFNINLPQAAFPINETISDNASGLDNILHNRTALVVEDDPDLLCITSEILEEMGLRVLRASDGIYALEVQDSFEEQIDILMTDMVMPRMGGAKLAGLFQEIRPSTAIVFSSGYPLRGDISNVDIPENAVFLAKPVQQEDLRECLEKVVAGKAIQTQSATWK